MSRKSASACECCAYIYKCQYMGIFRYETYKNMTGRTNAGVLCFQNSNISDRFMYIIVLSTDFFELSYGTTICSIKF